ncbi:MAG: HAMP domain-containing protein [Actinophytocola sp.]|nr:HAMP domain-containing protein [Actinophytocola sp.]
MPGPSVFVRELAWVNFIVVPAYLVIASVIGTLWSLAHGLRVLDWITAERELTERERLITLRLPGVLTAIHGVMWLAGLVLFATLYAVVKPAVVPNVAFSIVLSGTVTFASSFLLSEFALRPIAAHALTEGPPQRRITFGVGVRTVVFWAAGSAVPVAGLMLVALTALVRGEVSVGEMSIIVLALGGVTLLAGFSLTVLSTRATTAPIRTVYSALSRVRQGDFESKIVVFDGTELGRLQAGFNDMAAGLRERERVKDLFGRHVGEDVAQVAMSQRVELGGELREVAVLFVDVVGSTRIAATRPPTEVVEVLNRFFAVVVDEVGAHGGFVNKFQGDAALAIFGAPAELPDADCKALQAARKMIERLEREIPEFSAGIGVSAGSAVAGNVGAESRFEYTVIGDPVNEAARLTELAKSVPGHVAVSMRALEGSCDTAERVHWREYRQVKLRGRTEPTRVAVLAID